MLRQSKMEPLLPNFIRTVLNAIKSQRSLLYIFYRILRCHLTVVRPQNLESTQRGEVQPGLRIRVFWLDSDPRSLKKARLRITYIQNSSKNDIFLQYLLASVKNNKIMIYWFFFNKSFDQLSNKYWERTYIRVKFNRTNLDTVFLEGHPNCFFFTVLSGPGFYFSKGLNRIQVISIRIRKSGFGFKCGINQIK